MTAFEYYISFYGFMLGLSAATLLGRFADVVGARHKIRIGWLTALLALFILLQMTAIWAWTWSIRTDAEVTWRSIFEASATTSAFYLAAALVFPRDLDNWVELDEHYWKNKRIVVSLVLACAMVSTIHTIVHTPSLLADPVWMARIAAYFAPVVVLVFSRLRRVDVVALAVLILQLVIAGLGF